MQLENKKVLLMGLGILGGGVATARFLVEKGAILTITDMKDEVALKTSLEALKDLEGKIKYVLDGHKEEDFIENEIIVINPDVSIRNKFVELAREKGKQIENELTLFYKFCKSRKIVAITGTRGKTTTTNWTFHLLKSFYPNTILAGNSTENTFLGSLSKIDEDSLVVLEVPSFQLELSEDKNYLYAPKVAVITNIYRDHISRHGSEEEYARVKANISKSQIEDDFLLLNKENGWTNFILSLNPQVKTSYFSKEDNFEDVVDKVDFIQRWGMHNFMNLDIAIKVAKIFGVLDDILKEAIKTLPLIKFRQEKIYEDTKLVIYNDTTATSPDGTIVALERFAHNGDDLILIAGGTDRELDFVLWGQKIKQYVDPNNLILLSGSATEKMKKELGFEKYNEKDSLEDCLLLALEKTKKTNKKTIILFSPSAKSFEKFKNEYDRGEQFNLLVKKYRLRGVQ